MGYGLDGPDSIPGKDKVFLLSTDSYPMVSAGSFPGV
jgi:hypothetical protein